MLATPPMLGTTTGAAMPRDHRNADTRPYWAHSDPTAPQPNESTTPCPGEHNDANRYAETDDDTEPDLAPGNPIWCDGCATAIRSPLLYLPGLVDDLEIEIEEATNAAPERVSGTRTRALHAHQAQALLIDEIRDILGQFEDEVREWRNLTARRRDVRRNVSINRSAALLLAHLDWILAKAPGTQDAQGLVRAFADRLRRLDRRAMRLTHKTEPKPEPCIGVRCKNKSCDLMTLVRTVDRTGADKGEIVCENCRSTMTLREYREWAIQWGVYEYAHFDERPQEQREQLSADLAAYERTRAAR